MPRLGLVSQQENTRAVVRWLRITPSFQTHNILALLDDFERRKATSFKFEADRQAYIAAHGLLRLVAAQKFDVCRFHLRYTAHGKPKIVGADLERFDVNISHTRGFAAIGMTRVGWIGVDVEATRQNELVEDVARQAFSATERREMDSSLFSERRERFLTIWTLKEAVVKATGQGLSDPLHGFTVCSDPVGLITTPDGSDPLNWRLYTTSLGGARLAVALKMESIVEMPFDVNEIRVR